MSQAASPTPPHIQIELRSHPQYLSGVREMLSSVTKRLGFSDTQCSQVALAVDEALCNVMRHGYKRKTDQPIWVKVWPLDAGLAEAVEGVEAAAIRIVIEDQAEQVDPAAIRSRNLDEIRPGGLGVHIIKEVMDEARYEKREGGVGMRLTMVKKRVSEKASGTSNDGGLRGSSVA
jgi:anti-sigma regulatory factor (Ser/Thr protein kinase)